VQSEETRLHLQDAHQRVISVATVQQQLQSSGLNESIAVGPYLSKLCASLAASMIGDRRPLAIKVQATPGRAVSSEAVSMASRENAKAKFWSATKRKTLAGASRSPITDPAPRKRAARPHIPVSVRASSRRWRINSTLRSPKRVDRRARP
jgi:hypothetical protein